MLLSIIIPYYNIEDKYLIRSLTSVQDVGISSKEYEIILVDDGSDIQPAQAKARFSESNQIHWHRIGHRGLGAARNHGMKQAQGDYILFLDADDYLYKDSLPPVWEETKKTECDIMRIDYRFCTSMEQEHPAQPSPLTFTPPFSGKTYMQTSHLPGMACVYLFKKELCNHIGLTFVEEGFIEDEAFTTILHDNAHSIIRSNAKVYAYYKRADSITLTPSEERQSELIQYHYRAILTVYDYLHISRQKQSDTSGLERKLNSLTVDIIRRILTHPSWKAEWKIYEPQLKSLDLFPLRDCNYTSQYTIFSLLANHGWSRILLRKLLKRKAHQSHRKFT